MDGRWFLFGAILAGFIIAFNKPAARAIESQFSATPPKIRSKCGGCSGAASSASIPSSASARVLKPGQSQSEKAYRRAKGSPAPPKQRPNPNFGF